MKSGDAKGVAKKGFASMSEEEQRRIASKGGKAAHASGTAHEFSSDEARAAGRKGGLAVSADAEYMAKIGRRGGERSQAKRRGKAAKKSRVAKEET